MTSEALDHQGTFRNPSDQIDYISQTLKDSRYRRSGDECFFHCVFTEYSYILTTCVWVDFICADVCFNVGVAS